MRELTKVEEDYLVTAYFAGTLAFDGSSKEIRCLCEKGLVKDRDWPTRLFKANLTELGRHYVEAIPPEILVLKLLNLFYPFNALDDKIEELVSKVSLEGLPILLSHEDSKIRELARKRFKELKEK